MNQAKTCVIFDENIFKNNGCLLKYRMAPRLPINIQSKRITLKQAAKIDPKFREAYMKALKEAIKNMKEGQGAGALGLGLGMGLGWQCLLGL